ncbi:MAG TPA: hypothetical protein VIH18_24460 [Candidatus Binatia bacterium]|jgi:hypothetical protein
MSEVKYSIALRCIGQDLVQRGLRTFDIKREGSHFIALCRNQDPPSATTETVRYTPADIEFLDRSGESRRGEKAEKEFLHQAQMLRAIGDFLDKYGSTLIHITNNAVQVVESMFRVEYVTREGEHIVDDSPGSAIFDMCVLMVQKRKQNSTANGRAGHR